MFKLRITMLAVNLPLDIRESALARRSSRQEPWQAMYHREITPDDLIQFHSSNLPTNSRAPLAKIRDPHHYLAQMVADGKKTVEISAVTGYSPSRIDTLRSDPAFMELVAHYEEQNVFAQPDIVAQIRHVTLTAGAILMERLEQNPDEFTIKELQALRDAGLDRIGHGSSTKVNVSVNDPSHVIQQLKEMQAVEKRGRIISREAIEAEFTEVEIVEATPSAGTVEG